MSNLISGKEAKLAWANDENIEYMGDDFHWVDIDQFNTLKVFDRIDFKFRIKPKTVNLNGVDVGLLVSSEWQSGNPNKVILEFKSEDEARYFQDNAMKIFNGV